LGLGAAGGVATSRPGGAGSCCQSNGRNHTYQGHAHDDPTPDCYSDAVTGANISNSNSGHRTYILAHENGQSHHDTFTFTVGDGHSNAFIYPVTDGDYPVTDGDRHGTTYSDTVANLGWYASYCRGGAFLAGQSG
jgi:hypothetical protein